MHNEQHLGLVAGVQDLAVQVDDAELGVHDPFVVADPDGDFVLVP
jgi:hypothetical protein